MTAKFCSEAAFGGAKALAADLSSDSDDISEADPKLHAARMRERKRCEAIIQAGIDAGNLAMAKQLAFDTSMARGEAIDLIWNCASAAVGQTRPAMKASAMLRAAGRH